ncbi:hypothetical protein Mapa_005002 [Marchantia paleacea]|nr:hypothetical protein Mapa_005002 [Marchantia paleacea]
MGSSSFSLSDSLLLWFLVIVLDMSTGGILIPASTSYVSKHFSWGLCRETFFL